MRKMILAAMCVASTLALPLTAAPAGHIDLYVSGMSGNDSVTCLNANNGCRTIQAAIDRIPIVLDQHVIVHIAPGTYSESLMLADRLAPKGHEIRLIGDPGVVRLAGARLMPVGILIKNSPRVVLENLEITEYTEAGVLVQHSEALLTSTRVVWNRSHALVCEYGDLVIETGAPARGVSLLNNLGSGILASSCHVRFDGPATIAENGIGVMAAHGALIDLSARSDVSVMNNPPAPPAVVPGGSGGAGDREGPRRAPLPGLDEAAPLCQLVADCHGMIAGYEHAQIGGDCVCGAVDYGICHP